MRLLFKIMQQVLRKLIDWLMSIWLWANRHEKQIEEQRNHESK